MRDHELSRLSIHASSRENDPGGAAGEWFKKDCIGSVTTWEDLVEMFVQKFYQLSCDNEEIEAEEDDDLDDIADIFKIKRNLFNYEIPLCKAFNDFNYLLKIDRDLFTFDIQGIRTYKEHELNNHVTRDIEEPWLDKGLPGMVWVGSMIYFQGHKWYDELADGKLKEETLMHKAKVEKSWGNATPECWWKTNAHEVAPFTRLENYSQRQYAKLKTKKAHDPYLILTIFFGRNSDTSNAGNTQDNQGQEERRDDPTHEPSVCKIRRFAMLKYSFNADEEYNAIKESEYLNHSKDNLDAYRELLHIIDEGLVIATPNEE
ncbi:hypothetical protein Tco_0260506 [Tanacetum coccineum]